MMIDGNRRWAKQLGYDSAAHGHRAGAAKMRDFLGWCDEIGVRVVSLYLLSNDNLRKRDTKELSDLIEIIAELADGLSHERDWRVKHVGRVDLLPAPLARALAEAEERTRDTARAGLDHLDELFGAPATLGTEMAISTLAGIVDPAQMRAIAPAYIAELRAELDLPV